MCVAPVAGFAAEDIECGYFNPAFGLCSTHSHNVKFVDDNEGMPANPTESEDVAQMNEIIALKSTVIAQQMKEQYDQLNAIIKRFKTQLEKAVLTSKIEVATGNSASNNTGGRSSSGPYNQGLSSANDCSLVEYDKVFDCLMANMQKIQQSSSGDLTAARHQLEKDLGIIDTYSMCKSSNNDIACSNATDYKDKCASKTSSKQISTCASWLYAQVNMAKNRYNTSQKSYDRYR